MLYSHRRQIYDATGSLEHSEELTSAACKDLYEYYKQSVEKVCVKVATLGMPPALGHPLGHPRGNRRVFQHIPRL